LCGLVSPLKQFLRRPKNEIVKAVLVVEDQGQPPRRNIAAPLKKTKRMRKGFRKPGMEKKDLTKKKGCPNREEKLKDRGGMYQIQSSCGQNNRNADQKGSKGANGLGSECGGGAIAGLSLM